jgi:hypothetical protein
LSNWKKLVVSGSQAHLASVTASNGSIISGSLTMSGSITNITNADFNTSPPQSLSSTVEGRLSWDAGARSLVVGAGNNVDYHVAQQEFAYVVNAEATTLTKGEVVYVSGSQGNTIAVKRANDSGDAFSAGTLGLVAESIASGAEGLVLVNGLMRKLDTSTLTAGKLLFLGSTPGTYTETIPTAPSHSVRIGYVAKVDVSQGEIYVKIDNGYEIGELHDIVDGTTTTSYGDLLVKSGSVWKNSKQLTGSYGLTGSLQATSFTGSLQGTATTASYVLNAVSSSFATTASFVLGGGGGASVTNPGNNFVITSDGTSGGLVGESNLTFDGSTLAVTGKVTATSFTGSLQYFDFNANTNYTYGVGIGLNAFNNYDYGIGIGQNAFDNYTYGVGIGAGSINNYNYGVAIGYNTYQNYNYGVGIGESAFGNYNYGVGVGASTNTNTKGTGTVTIGAYSKAERQNEFVTTATDNTINKAQSIIQKFRNKTLASSGGIWQEIFTDASSARLTILASSVYHYRIQINAIGATGFLCKTWEITGAIKRDASNNTTMVGGAPTYLITSEDASTSNWDVRVTADDTNEALEIEVKHDYANNVTFSATVWATETRL